MRTATIHPIKIPFDIPVGPGKKVSRFVYAYVLDGARPWLVDTGVAGAEKDISIVLQTVGRKLSDVGVIVLTHSHADHIGSASRIQRLSGAQVWAHWNERTWIEDPERQGRERPVPGFAELVSGPVRINRFLMDGDILSLDTKPTFRVLHTPGHSSGSISLLSEEDGVLFCGDVIPQAGDMPIYDDLSALANSLVRLAKIENLSALYSSWAEPLYGQKAVDAVFAGMRHLKTIHTVVLEAGSELADPDPVELCKRCVRMLGLPPFAANPLVQRSLLAHKKASAETDLDLIFEPFLAGGHNG